MFVYIRREGNLNPPLKRQYRKIEKRVVGAY